MLRWTILLLAGVFIGAAAEAAENTVPAKPENAAPAKSETVVPASTSPVTGLLAHIEQRTAHQTIAVRASKYLIHSFCRMKPLQTGSPTLTPHFKNAVVCHLSV